MELSENFALKNQEELREYVNTCMEKIKNCVRNYILGKIDFEMALEYCVDVFNDIYIFYEKLPKKRKKWFFWKQEKSLEINESELLALLALLLYEHLGKVDKEKFNKILEELAKKREHEVIVYFYEIDMNELKQVKKEILK